MTLLSGDWKERSEMCLFHGHPVLHSVYSVRKLVSVLAEGQHSIVAKRLVHFQFQFKLWFLLLCFYCLVSQIWTLISEQDKSDLWTRQFWTLNKTSLLNSEQGKMVVNIATFFLDKSVSLNENCVLDFIIHCIFLNDRLHTIISL